MKKQDKNMFVNHILYSLSDLYISVAQENE